MSPEYLHILLNPLPVAGVLMGLIGLIVAFALRSRPARVVALSIVLLSSAIAWPAWYFGEKAYDDVMMIADDPGSKWMDEHRSRAEKMVVVFYVLAALSLAAIVVPVKWPRSDVPLSGATLVVAVVALAAGAYIAYAGGRIRHSEFRSGAPPAAAEPGKAE